MIALSTQILDPYIAFDAMIQVVEKLHHAFCNRPTCCHECRLKVATAYIAAAAPECVDDIFSR